MTRETSRAPNDAKLAARVADLCSRMLSHLKLFTEFWGRAGAGTHAAATAYFAIFSLAPLVMIAIAVAGFFLGRDQARTAILKQFQATFGSDFRGFAESLVASQDSGSGIFAAFIGGILVLFGAARIFGALRDGLDGIFDNLPNHRKPGIWSGVLEQLISIGIVLSLGFLLLVSLVLSTGLAMFAEYLRALVPGALVFASIADFVVTYVLISGFLALLIAFLPSKRVASRTALAGGVMAAAIFVVGKYAMTMYFALAQPANAFGAAAAMVVVVLWVYYLTLGLFISAIVARMFYPTRIPLRCPSDK